MSLEANTSVKPTHLSGTGSTIGRVLIAMVMATAILVQPISPAAAATVTATVCLFDSSGVGIEGAQASYYASGWQALGTTAADGCVGTDSPKAIGNTSFQVIYGGQSQQISQNTATNPTITFQTVKVTAQFYDSTGTTGIENGLIRYYANGWKTLGTTDTTGTATGELMGGNTSFQVIYGGQSQQISQNTATNPTITFQTGRVLQGTGPRVISWRASNWVPFVNGVELLPGAITFTLDNAKREVHTVVAGATIYVPTAPTAPVVTLGGDQTVNEGDEVILEVSFIDQEPSQTHQASIDWGDASPLDTGAVLQADGTAGAVTGAHVYKDQGTYSVRVCVTDDGSPDAEGCETMLITVTNVAPQVTITGTPETVTEGSKITLNATVTDPGTTDEITTVWSVTHNNTPIATGTGTNFTFTAHNDGTYHVTVTATDNTGDTGTDQTPITVTNVAPQVTITGTAPVVTDDPTTEDETSTEPAGLDDAELAPTSERDVDGTVAPSDPQPRAGSVAMEDAPDESAVSIPTGLPAVLPFEDLAGQAAAPGQGPDGRHQLPFVLVVGTLLVGLVVVWRRRRSQQ
jgi:hypothetical protein